MVVGVGRCESGDASFLPGGVSSDGGGGLVSLGGLDLGFVEDGGELLAPGVKEEVNDFEDADEGCANRESHRPAQVADETVDCVGPLLGYFLQTQLAIKYGDFQEVCPQRAPNIPNPKTEDRNSNSTKSVSIRLSCL